MLKVLTFLKRVPVTPGHGLDRVLSAKHCPSGQKSPKRTDITNVQGVRIKIRNDGQKTLKLSRMQRQRMQRPVRGDPETSEGVRGRERAGNAAERGMMGRVRAE